MKAFLMHRDRDFDLEREPPPNGDDLTRDLALGTLFEAMARGDPFLHEVARRAVLSSLTDPEEIVYRQEALADCLERREVVRRLYALAADAAATDRKIRFGWIRGTPDTILSRSVQMLELLVASLRELRRIGDEHADGFRSPAFTRFFAMLRDELDDAYFQTVEEQLNELRFRRGVLLGAGLGKGNKGTRYVLRRQRERTWRERLSPRSGSGLGFRIADRDENGFRALEELRGRGVNLVANALAQSTDHIVDFFSVVRAELGFYVGCLNLEERLAGKGEPTCFPVAEAPDPPRLAAAGLYDPCLSLLVDARVVGNELAADGRRLVIVTGANQGGKSTFLRSVGVAQLLLQCGMFVPAESFRASVCDGLFTHYKREEDAGMESGKLDEELARMSRIAGALRPGGMLLCNESFAATNEREGSEIARQVVRALLEGGVRVLFVTHLFDLAHGFYEQRLDTALFLRAGRESGGLRTFRLVEGEPLPTSYGEDSYRRVFGAGLDAELRASAGGRR